jgi:nucleotide-binding universal stress UspA family protein
MIYPIRTIVAGIADLTTEDPILVSAIRLAERTGAALHLVHAFELPDLMWDAYARMGYMDGEALQQYSDSLKARLESCAGAVSQARPVTCHAMAGPSALMIDEISRRESADLIVVGATRHGAVMRMFLGTTAQRVLRSASAPVLVLRTELPTRLERVLLTTDLSSFSAGIHEAALDVLETAFEGDISEMKSLLVVWPGADLTPPIRRELLESVTDEVLASFLQERRDRGRVVEGLVRYGDPAKEIVAHAEQWKADLLVVGTHARPAPKRWILGSVAEATVRSTPVNVLVIPAVMEEKRTLPVPRELGEAPRPAPRIG